MKLEVPTIGPHPLYHISQLVNHINDYVSSHHSTIMMNVELLICSKTSIKESKCSNSHSKFLLLHVKIAIYCSLDLYNIELDKKKMFVLKDAMQ